MKDHEKTCIKCLKCNKNFKFINKIRSIRKEVYQNNYTEKRYHAESTDESGSLSYKSRDKN